MNIVIMMDTQRPCHGLTKQCVGTSPCYFCNNQLKFLVVQRYTDTVLDYQGCEFFRNFNCQKFEESGTQMTNFMNLRKATRILNSYVQKCHAWSIITVITVMPCHTTKVDMCL